MSNTGRAGRRRSCAGGRPHAGGQRGAVRRGGDACRGAGGAPPGQRRVVQARTSLDPIASYDAVHARAELTGTGDGRLFAAFEGSPYIVAEIDKRNANVMSQTPMQGVNYDAGSSHFAFAFWGGDFFLFVGPPTSTEVFRYRPTDGTTVKVAAGSFAVVGAGVSTCAPTAGPR